MKLLTPLLQSDPVMGLLRKRAAQYLTDASLNKKVPVPKGFDLTQERLVKIGADFDRIVDFNRKAYGSHYAAILKELQ